MEPHKAKRAVFIAAGFGTRLVPITLNTPKPLVRVHGERIIDSLIDACLEAGIEEIYIVRGYLA
jgi:NDP-sugar pyrophosphorylase family protein